tara:strand:- start:159 stop:542 length:384 start_codon:yes stop_codon:yes gene_type:complete
MESKLIDQEPKHFKVGWKIRRISDGKFFRKNTNAYWTRKMTHEEIHYHTDAIKAHLYETKDKALRSIGQSLNWSSGKSPIHKKDDILNLEIIPATQYKYEVVQFGEPEATYWHLDIIESHFIVAFRD